MRWTALVALLFTALLAVPLAASQGGVHVSVLIDFGDGRARWAEVTLEDNRTAILATERAAAALGLTLDVVWGPFGAFVSRIGGEPAGPTEFWALYEWRVSLWTVASLGASSLTLDSGDVIAWVVTGWDESFAPVREPEATLAHRDPVTSFRGDRENTGQFSPLSAGDPTLAWSFDTKAFEISATPVASRDVAFVVTWEGTFALELSTGDLLWSREDVAGMSTPALFNGNLLVGARDGRVHYVAGSDGRELWSQPLLDPRDVAFTGVSSSPTIVGSTAFVGAFNESGGAGGVFALSMTNGSPLWRHETGSVHQSSPAVHGGTVYVGVSGSFDPATLTFQPPHGLLALSAGNGTLVWFYETPSAVASSPAYLGGSLYFTSRDGILHAVDAGTGSLVWEQEVGFSTSSPAVSESAVYVGSGSFAGGGAVHAFDASGGALWVAELDGGVQSSVALAGDRLYATTNAANGQVVALNLAAGSAEWALAPNPPEFILSSPVTTGGYLLVASDNGIVYAYRTGGSASFAADMAVLALPAMAAVFLVIILWGRRR